MSEWHKQLYRMVGGGLYFLEHGVFVTVDPKDRSGGISREVCMVKGEDKGACSVAQKHLFVKLDPEENAEQLAAVKWFEERYAKREFPYNNI